MSTYSKLMEALDCSTDHVVTDHDLQQLKVLLNNVWSRLKINIAFTNHFLDRVNDARNNKQITVCELARLFMEAFKKFGSQLAHISQREWEAVLEDEQTNINVPFVLKHNGRTVELVSKTVMRKKNFFTPDPKLAVAHYEPGKKNMGKTFRELKEWVGINYPDNDTGRAIQAVDDVDTAAFDVPDESVVEKLNMFLTSLCQKQVINPYYILNDIWKKLSIVGLNFDMRAVTFMGVNGRVNVPVTQYGGRYGVLGDPTSYVSQDDGTRIPGGLTLSITFQKTGGVYTLHAQLERGADNSPFVESAKPVSEAVSPIQARQDVFKKHGYGHKVTIGGDKVFEHPNGNQIHMYHNGGWQHMPSPKSGVGGSAPMPEKMRKELDDLKKSHPLKETVSEAVDEGPTYRKILDAHGYKWKEGHKNHKKEDVHTYIHPAGHTVQLIGKNTKRDWYHNNRKGNAPSSLSDQLTKTHGVKESVNESISTSAETDNVLKQHGFEHKGSGNWEHPNGKTTAHHNGNGVQLHYKGQPSWGRTANAKLLHGRIKALNESVNESITNSPMFKHMKEKGFNHVASGLHGQAIERSSADSADEHHFEHPSGKKAVAKKTNDGWSIQTEAFLSKPKEPATATLSDADRIRVSLEHAKKKVAYWQAIIAHRRSKGEDTSHATKMLGRAETSLQTWTMHHNDSLKKK